MTEEDAKRIIRLTRPQAKFGGYTHTDDFLDLEAKIGKGFYYVSLYDEDINSNLTETRDGILLVSNSYLSSFAYNLVLAWHYEDRLGQVRPGQTNPLIKHNFKKFFAEQLIHQYNNTFSRAVFLETLLYEQQLMIPVIGAANEDPEWSRLAGDIAAVMGNLLLFHELGHYYRRFQPEMYEEVMRVNQKAVGPFLEMIARNYPEAFNEEVRCDLMGIFSLLALPGQDTAAATFALRAAVLGYSIFAVLWSFQKSAEATAKAHRAEPDEIIFRSIEKSNREYTYIIGRYTDMIERARLVTRLCEALAADRNLNLYGQDGTLPLPEDMLDYLLTYVETAMEHDDGNQRAMARLMAEALHGHEAGLDYLYLHSKVFKANRSLNL